MRRIVPLVCVGLFLFVAAESAFAQQRLFVRMLSEIVELDSRQPSLGAVIRRFPVPANRHPVTFSGGKSLAWADGGVVLLDTFSGAVRRFTFPDFSASHVIGTDGNARLVVLGTNESRADKVLVADARSGSVRFLDVGRISAFHPAIAYAHASDILFVAKPRGPGADTYHDIDVIQASTGVLLKTLDIWPASAIGLSTNAEGTRLYVGSERGAFAFDVPTGTRFASAPSSAFGGLDELRNRLINHLVIPPGGSPEHRPLRGIAAYSPDSLQFLGRAQVPDLPLPTPPRNHAPFLTEQIDVSGLSATIFVLQSVGWHYKYASSPSTCTDSRLLALNADTGQVRQTVRTTATLGPGACDGGLVRITEPAPPPALTANVSGRRVTLNWRAPFGAIQYEVEAGSAPGLANITTIRVSDPQLVVDAVPTGTYHVRVHAINTIGKSGASQEVSVVVP